MNEKFLRVSEPSLTGLEYRYVKKSYRSTQISGSGYFVERAEDQIKSLTGAAFALVTNNGTASLHLSLMALGIGPGDKVLVPSFTYIAAVNAILYVGATPVYVEISQENWTLSPERIDDLVDPSTKAIMAVHTYGHPVDSLKLQSIAKKHNLFLVEDAAEAPVSTSHGIKAGQIGDVASFSFFANKIIAAGEGGCITTNNEELYEKAKLIRNQGMSPNRRFEHNIVGNNFRLNNMSAAVLSAQLERSNELVKKRQLITERYFSLFGDLDLVDMQPICNWADWSPWLFSILLEPRRAKRRDELQAELLGAGIETRPFFIPAHLLKPYQGFLRPEQTMAVSEDISRRGLNLPTSAKMTERDVDRVVDNVSRLMERA